MAENRKIIIARAELALTQKDLANAVGVSRQTIVSIEKGNCNPSLKLCKAICRELGKSLSDLFEN
ncbi:MAG: helix-turn-helix transcriptional regulator [Clostridia bacterium]|nr:helix-turn-helix transcriptional regulator [Clostridia bacterium]MBR2455527.1 helix-turn-helix transcriptional regulator [Clostridia bacterium]MBR3592699.1 helix-turn-helix transcriptional regulator [Clostridia bacterium]